MVRRIPVLRGLVAEVDLLLALVDLELKFSALAVQELKRYLVFTCTRCAKGVLHSPLRLADVGYKTVLDFCFPGKESSARLDFRILEVERTEIWGVHLVESRIVTKVVLQVSKVPS